MRVRQLTTASWITLLDDAI